MTTPTAKRKLPVYFYVSVALAAVVVVLAAQLYAITSKANVALSVNGDVITKDELINELIRQTGTGVMDDLIVQRLIAQEADRKGIILTDEDVDAEINRTVQNLSEADKARWNSASPSAKESFRKNTRVRLLVEKILGPDVEITEEGMRDYFDKHKEELSKPTEVRARHILVDSEEKARAIKARLDAGEDFAEVAKKESTDSGSAQNGGDLGFFTKGRMVAGFEEAAFSLPVGAVSEPVKTNFGYHIIRVDERKEGVAAEYDKVKDEVRSRMMRDALQTKFPEWLNSLKSSAKIQNYVLDRGVLPEAPASGEGGNTGNTGAAGTAPATP